MDKQPATLLRTLTLPLVTFYGLGNILGAGIYVLIGNVAGHAGYGMPVAFMLAALVALITAFSYAELGSRFPLSAGEAVYVQYGLGLPFLSLVTGLLIIFTGIVSAATIARGFVGYLDVFIRLPEWLVITALIGILTLLAVWGILESIRTAALFTVVEVAGLLIILYLAGPLYGGLPARLPQFTAALHTGAWEGIILGAFLAFYAFVGFEDMVNVAEEVTEPRRNLPRAILLSLAIATLLYLGISIAALLAMDPGELAAADAPLAAVYEHLTGRRPVLIAVISLFAVVNGALIQIIMASRVCYGLSRQHWLPAVLGRVHPLTRTPVIATLLVALVILVLALWLPLEALARTTSYLLLIIFALVNLSLWRIKAAGQVAAAGTFSVPPAVPLAGFLSCLAFLLLQTALV